MCVVMSVRPLPRRKLIASLLQVACGGGEELAGCPSDRLASRGGQPRSRPRRGKRAGGAARDRPSRNTASSTGRLLSASLPAASPAGTLPSKEVLEKVRRLC